MFEELIQTTGIAVEPESFSIEEERWKSKHQATDNHIVVVNAEIEIGQVEGFDWFHFDRNNLKDVWSLDCSLPTKYLATLWWGHVFPQIFNEVYSSSNLNRLVRISPKLGKALDDASHEKNFTVFREKLSSIVESMQLGTFRLPYVGVAFFTKVIQFFFASHPIQSKEEFLPIIADRWLLRAIYCEMTDCGDTDKRDDFLVIDHKIVFLKKDSRGCVADSYFKYIQYFNQRCADLGVHPWDMEALLFKNSAVKRHFSELIGNEENEMVPDNNVRLRVYDGNGYNHGKTFQIINNKATLPHNTDSVFVDFNGLLCEATLGSYCGGGNTLRGKEKIKKLIEDNHWLPGQEFQVEFLTAKDGAHIYRIIQ